MDINAVVAAVVTIITGMAGFVAFMIKWVLNRFSNQLDDNTRAVEKNTTAVSLIAQRFSEHMDKDEELDEKLIIGMNNTVEGIRRMEVKLNE